MPVPFKVKAVFDYKSDEPDDLNFAVGQIITVIEEEDDDWYTGEYDGPSGKVEGLFPRNFVERYEPAIPSRPVRNTQKSAQQQTTAPEAPPQIDSTPTSPLSSAPEAKARPNTEARDVEVAETRVNKPAAEVKPPETKPPAAKQPPPPVAEKPSSNSFKDRIAAFNKASAAPITPFKPSGGSSSANFIKKPFVAPPPARNSYVPPPNPAPQPAKAYRREEDPDMAREEDEDAGRGGDISRTEPAAEEDQPKPTSLKDRIALLQQQQMEQAQKAAEKRKVKKAPPPPERTDSADNEVERIETTEAPLARQETDVPHNRKSLDSDRDADTLSQVEDGPPEDEIAIPTVVPPPARELVSDTNDADDSGAADTDVQETSTEEDRRISKVTKSPPVAAAELSPPTRQANMEKVDAEEEAQEEDTEEEEDPEIRRRRELRERMAKMSGGMGMMGMFGPPGGASAPSKKPKAQRTEKPPSEPPREEETMKAPPVPIMALPGMSTRTQQRDEGGDSEEEPASPTPMESADQAGSEDYVSHQPVRTSAERSGPTSPNERAVPPPPPRESRAPPPAPPSVSSAPPIPQSPPGRSNLPPPPPPPTRDDTMDSADFAPSPTSGRTSLENKPLRQASTRRDQSGLSAGAPAPPTRSMTGDSFNSHSSAQERRAARPPPPPPTAAPTSPQTRAPPPPPPEQPPSRSVTGGSRDMANREDEVDDESEEEVTEYDGDYDTDIASSAKHKDALKAHNRDSSMDDEGTFTDEAHKLPSSPPTRAVPPLPPTGPPRDAPPPPPPVSVPKTRRSNEVPRGVPPPIPNPPITIEGGDEEEYDPYKYSAPQHAVSSPPLPQMKSPPVPRATDEDGDMYGAPAHAPPPMPPPSHQVPPPPPAERAAPPPPPSERAVPPPPHAHSNTAMMAGGLGPNTFPAPAPKQSLDIQRAPTVSRRSAEQSRPSADFGFMASDIDLAEASLWWAHENTLPPSISANTDILYEVESNTTTKRGGKSTINRDVYVLYMDYSQTTINVSFDPNDPSSASLSQAHQRPPPPPRQDQLESVSHSFGSKIATAAVQANGTTVADGSAQGFIWTILQPIRGTALMPIGNRSFGATVYSNLANASTQQFDEIRPGDIVTFRNAKFSGHKGGLHQKYSMEVGYPGRDHVAVVIDWDGTKKKIRAWEQGRDEKKGSKGKVREESFRIGDLKSGEVRVWRVMGRSWVGWDSS